MDVCLTGAIVFARESGDAVGLGVRKSAGFRGEAEAKEGATVVTCYTYVILEDVERTGSKNGETALAETFMVNSRNSIPGDAAACALEKHVSVTYTDMDEVNVVGTVFNITGRTTKQPRRKHTRTTKTRYTTEKRRVPPLRSGRCRCSPQVDPSESPSPLVTTVTNLEPAGPLCRLPTAQLKQEVSILILL